MTDESEPKVFSKARRIDSLPGGKRVTVAQPEWGFEYTTPNAVPKQTVKQAIKRGCASDVRKYKSKKDGSQKQRQVITDPRKECIVSQDPCSELRNTCPVQLFFDSGQPKLRFCRAQPNKKARLAPGEKPKFPKQRAPKQKGFTIAVDNAIEAQRIAAAACRCWKKSPEGFAQIVHSKKGKPSTVWRGSFEACTIGEYEPGAAPLGGARRRRRKQR